MAARKIRKGRARVEMSRGQLQRGIGKIIGNGRKEEGVKRGGRMIGTLVAFGLIK